MPTPRFPKRLVDLWQQGKQTAQTFNKYANDWPWVLVHSLRQTLNPDTTIMASAIAYISLFSLFPLILLSISLASFSLGSLMMNQQETIQRLEFIAPALGELLGQNINEVIRARGPVTGFALLSLIWSASTVFYTLTHTLNQIWNVKQRRSSWRTRGGAILFVLVFIGPALFLISLGGSVIANIRFWLPHLILPLSPGISMLLTILLDVTLFLVLYLILPHGSATWHEILPGAIGAGMLWELAKEMFLSFVSNYITMSNLVYGTVAAIIAFLFWAYISSLIFIFGAHVCVSYWKLKHPPKEV